MKRALGTDPDHQCKVCDLMDDIILELVQELRVRMRPEYAMLVMLTCADRFLDMAADEQGVDEISKRQGLLILVNETVAAMPFPPDLVRGDFPNPGPQKERWDGMDALKQIDRFLIDVRGIEFVFAAQVCARVARAMGVFMRDPELAYLAAFGETLLGRARAAGSPQTMQPGTEVVGVTLFGGVKRHGGALN